MYWRENQQSHAMNDLQILPRSRGVMAHDFWSPYFKYLSRHALCYTQIIRELRSISDNYGRKWNDCLHDLIYEIKEAVDSARNTGSSLSHQQGTDFEEQYSLILEAGVEENPSIPLSDLSQKEADRSSQRRRISSTDARNTGMRSYRSWTTFLSPFLIIKLRGISG